MLHIENIVKSYNESTVLRGIDLDVEAGEFVSLLGPSGCGKTTLLRILCGIERADQGRLLFNGDDITCWPAARRGFGVVFQSYALFPNLTAAQNIAFGLKGQPAAAVRERVAEMLALVGLSNQAQRYPAQLSGGQQQRIALARALAPKPRLLLLDEPLSALDAQVRAELRSEIRELQRKLGITCIMVTHDQEEALTMADRIVLMHRGRIEQEGSPEQLYAQPVSHFAAGFVGRMNLLPGVALDERHVQIGSSQVVCVNPLFGAGENILVGVRPESVVIHPAHPTALSNLFRARVMETSFLGPMVLVRLHSPSLDCHIEAQWPLRHGSSLPDWLQGEVLVELPATALQPLAAPEALQRKAA
ncbi:ABC transporter ATP-binding protein [Diaphorobacter caeni]|uniref:ABC transporter ATP-binding protein n=1 Tax=Diaphorobacter caeni TaxID=2784387 RepID=UPI00188F04CC|nr:ATP-binding cassette domain-containing protein [Diaphorobacter caeni]MBF5006482.1 ATP-binding cassette domain-containing protein [Diaphorobacter caeni]